MKVFNIENGKIVIDCFETQETLETPFTVQQFKNVHEFQIEDTLKEYSSAKINGVVNQIIEINKIKHPINDFDFKVKTFKNKLIDKGFSLVQLGDDDDVFGTDNSFKNSVIINANTRSATYEQPVKEIHTFFGEGVFDTETNCFESGNYFYSFSEKEKNRCFNDKTVVKYIEKCI